jgi:hypothetical protein
MTEEGSRGVHVRATYWIRDFESPVSSSPEDPPTRIQGFGSIPSIPNDTGGSGDASYETVEEPLRIGLPEGVQPEKRPAGDDSYCGLHDQGPLPPLKEGGPMAVLLACTQRAKKFNDDYLTNAMAAQRKAHEGASGSTFMPLKKPKVDSS